MLLPAWPLPTSLPIIVHCMIDCRYHLTMQFDVIVVGQMELHCRPIKCASVSLRIVGDANIRG